MFYFLPQICDISHIFQMTQLNKADIYEYRK